MEDSKTKYIESSLAAFRAIKTFVFIKGIYPRNFNTGFWDKEDYPKIRTTFFIFPKSMTIGDTLSWHRS